MKNSKVTDVEILMWSYKHKKDTVISSDQGQNTHVAPTRETKHVTHLITLVSTHRGYGHIQDDTTLERPTTYNIRSLIQHYNIYRSFKKIGKTILNLGTLQLRRALWDPGSEVPSDADCMLVFDPGRDEVSSVAVSRGRLGLGFRA